MNDILFILLLFFLIVSTLANPNVVKLTQPKSKSDTKAKQTVVVSIDANKQDTRLQQSDHYEGLKAVLAPVIAKETDQPSIAMPMRTSRSPEPDRRGHAIDGQLRTPELFCRWIIRGNSRQRRQRIIRSFPCMSRRNTISVSPSASSAATVSFPKASLISRYTVVPGRANRAIFR